MGSQVCLMAMRGGKASVKQDIQKSFPSLKSPIYIYCVDFGVHSVGFFLADTRLWHLL